MITAFEQASITWHRLFELKSVGKGKGKAATTTATTTTAATAATNTAATTIATTTIAATTIASH